jgi:hypothetical protein
MAVLVQNGTPLTHAVDDRPDVSVGDESPSGTTVGDGFARTEEETGTECAGEGDHLHVALLHVTLDTIVCGGSAGLTPASSWASGFKPEAIAIILSGAESTG